MVKKVIQSEPSSKAFALEPNYVSVKNFINISDKLRSVVGTQKGAGRADRQIVKT